GVLVQREARGRAVPRRQALHRERKPDCGRARERRRVQARLVSVAERVACARVVEARPTRAARRRNPANTALISTGFHYRGNVGRELTNAAETVASEAILETAMTGPNDLATPSTLFVVKAAHGGRFVGGAALSKVEPGDVVVFSSGSSGHRARAYG